MSDKREKFGVFNELLLEREELEEVQNKWLAHIEKWEDKHIGNYRRIYPSKDSEKYNKYYNNISSLFSETAASKARIDLAK